MHGPILFVLLAALTLAPAPLAAFDTDSGGVPLEAVIRDFEKSLADAQGRILKRGLPRIRSVEVELQTYLERGSVGEAEVAVYSVEMPYDEDHAHAVTLELSRAADDTRYQTADASGSTSVSLVEHLVALAQASKAGQARNSGMRLRSLGASLRFVLKRSGTRGNFEAIPVSPGLGISLEDRPVHSLSVSFSANPS